MALRPVHDFDDKQWAQLMKNMKRGSTKKQLEVISEAKESLKNINIEFNS